MLLCISSENMVYQGLPRAVVHQWLTLLRCNWNRCPIVGVFGPSLELINAMKHSNSLYTLEDELFPEPRKPRYSGWWKWAIAVALGVLFVWRSTRPTVRLSADPPPSFFHYNRNWSPEKRREERRLAEAYWRVAVQRIQQDYLPDSSLPVNPPPQFQIADATKNLAADLIAARIHYWFRLREVWNQRSSWVVSYGWNTSWVSSTMNSLFQNLPDGIRNVIQQFVDFFQAVAQTISSA